MVVNPRVDAGNVAWNTSSPRAVKEAALQFPELMQDLVIPFHYDQQEGYMLVPATEVQNNFGKYLRICAIEPVVVTRNGVPQAVLSAGGDGAQASMAWESVVEYGTNPRKDNLMG